MRGPKNSVAGQSLLGWVSGCERQCVLSTNVAHGMHMGYRCGKWVVGFLCSWRQVVCGCWLIMLVSRSSCQA